MGGSSFDCCLQLFAVSLSVGIQCFDYFDHLIRVFFSACKLVILLIAQVKGCKCLKLASGKRDSRECPIETSTTVGRGDGGSRVGAGLPNLCAGEEGRRSESALSKGKWDTGLSPEGFLVIEKHTGCF